MDSEPFITLASSGMQPESSPSPANSSMSDSSSTQQDSSPASSISMTTHDISRTKYHIAELGIFAARLESASASIFPNKGRSRYKNVHVLLLRWEEDTMGVQYELDDLAKTFKLAYGFETETWTIPTKKSLFALNRKACDFIEDFGDPENLLIVYYAGHGMMNGSRQALWTCKSDINYASLEWYAIQPLFERTEADILLLLDCCAAASGAPTEGDKTSVTETIAACGFETWAPQPGRHSFTNTLIAVLDDWQSRPAFTAAMLHCEILNRLRHEKPEKYRNTKKFEYRKSPIHIFSTADPKARSVELSRRILPAITCKGQGVDAELPYGRGAGLSSLAPPIPSTRLDPCDDSENDPYNPSLLTRVLDNGDTALPEVLIALRLEEEQLLDLEQCKKWLQDFPALAKSARVQGVYKSNSTLMILSVPVVVWDWLPEDPACSFIGYVYSQNICDKVVTSPRVPSTVTPSIITTDVFDHISEVSSLPSQATTWSKRRLRSLSDSEPASERPGSFLQNTNVIRKRKSRDTINPKKTFYGHDSNILSRNIPSFGTLPTPPSSRQSSIGKLTPTTPQALSFGKIVPPTRARELIDNSGLVGLWRGMGGPPLPPSTLSLQSHDADVKPTTSSSTGRPRPEINDDDNESDQQEFDDDSTTLFEFEEPKPIVPNYNGFKDHVRRLYPDMDPRYEWLVNRIAHQQEIRYRNLLNLRVKHSQAILRGSCPSGEEFCAAANGRAATLSDSKGEPLVPDLISEQDVLTIDSFPPGVPMPPSPSLPAEFECRLCFRVKKIGKPSDWTKHVHEDVQPFTCTFEKCRELKSFKRKSDWVRHENERHRHLEWWICDVDDCRHPCYRKDNFLQHLVREHKLPEPKEKMKTAIKEAVAEGMNPVWNRIEQCHHETTNLPQEEPCKFCGKSFTTWKKLTVHLAKHMEQISLPILRNVREKNIVANTIISPVEQISPPMIRSGYSYEMGDKPPYISSPYGSFYNPLNNSLNHTTFGQVGMMTSNSVATANQGLYPVEQPIFGGMSSQAMAGLSSYETTSNQTFNQTMTPVAPPTAYTDFLSSLSNPVVPQAFGRPGQEQPGNYKVPGADQQDK